MLFFKEKGFCPKLDISVEDTGLFVFFCRFFIMPFFHFSISLEQGSIFYHKLAAADSGIYRRVVVVAVRAYGYCCLR